MTRMRVAVIPTNGRHHLVGALQSIMPQVDHTIVILHNCWPQVVQSFTRTDPVTLVQYDRTPPNISEMWNIGLDCADRLDPLGGMDVAILNDDVEVPPGWFDTVTKGMRDSGAIAGSSDQFGFSIPDWGKGGILHKDAEPIDVRLRMSGFAFILDADVGMRLDEQFRWWYGDDDLEWRARELGGVVKVAGWPVVHHAPGQSTVGELAAIAGEDRDRFQAKWGRTPH